MLPRLLDEGYRGRVDLVYTDPPFGAGRIQHSDPMADGSVMTYHDRGAEAFIAEMAVVLPLIHALLTAQGSLVIHADWHASHQLKLLLDQVFGPQGLRNEIIWKRASVQGRKADSSQLGRVTETLLWYTRGPRWTYHPLLMNERLPIVGDSLPPGYYRDEQGRYYRTAPRGDYTEASIARLEHEGRIHHSRSGKIRIKYFMERDGDHLILPRLMGNLWTDIPDAMHLPRAERTGYPTQKPLALASRVVDMFSSPGALILDPYAGSGTAGVAAALAGRSCILVDSSAQAVGVSRARMEPLVPQLRVDGADAAAPPPGLAGDQRTME